MIVFFYSYFHLVEKPEGRSGQILSMFLVSLNFSANAVKKNETASFVCGSFPICVLPFSLNRFYFLYKTHA